MLKIASARVQKGLYIEEQGTERCRVLMNINTVSIGSQGMVKHIRNITKRYTGMLRFMSSEYMVSTLCYETGDEQREKKYAQIFTALIVLNFRQNRILLHSGYEDKYVNRVFLCCRKALVKETALITLATK